MEELNFAIIDGEDALVIDPDLVESIVADCISPIKEKRKRKTKNYINNADFCEALIKYREVCNIHEAAGTRPPPIPDYIGKCWLKIAEGLAKKPNFYAYTYKDEMMSDTILNCTLYWKNFDPVRSQNPFAYFTQIAAFAFIRRIHTEKREQYVKYKSVQSYLNMEESEYQELSEGHIPQGEMYKNATDFIKLYEDTNFKKKEKVPRKLKVVSGGLDRFL